jgi:hypothetical protein
MYGSDLPPSGSLALTHHGFLTIAQMTAMLEPGAIDQTRIVGRRVRWTYTTTRRSYAEARLASDELRRLHLQLGAAEAIAHRGPWLTDDGA